MRVTSWTIATITLQQKKTIYYQQVVVSLVRCRIICCTMLFLTANWLVLCGGLGGNLLCLLCFPVLFFYWDVGGLVGFRSVRTLKLLEIAVGVGCVQWVVANVLLSHPTLHCCLCVCVCVCWYMVCMCVGTWCVCVWVGVWVGGWMWMWGRGEVGGYRVNISNYKHRVC